MLTIAKTRKPPERVLDRLQQQRTLLTELVESPAIKLDALRSLIACADIVLCPDAQTTQLSVRESVDVTKLSIFALQKLHKMGYVHCGLSPSKCILNDNQTGKRHEYGMHMQSE